MLPHGLCSSCNSNYFYLVDRRVKCSCGRELFYEEVSFAEIYREAITKGPTGQSTYTAALRANARAFWAGLFSQGQFEDQMYDTVEIGLTNAWQQGAKSCGILPEEMTGVEHLMLRAIISKEQNFIYRLADDLALMTKAVGGLLKDTYARIDAWTYRYIDVYHSGALSACSDQKFRWDIDPTIDNCPSCLSLNGRVHRASVWAEKGLQPQHPPNPFLKCGGHKCGCRFTKTDEPASRGRFPNLP